MDLIKKLFSLAINGARTNQYCLEIGTYFLKKGVGKKIGDPVKFPTKSKTRVYYIANLHYDFAKNRINHTLSKRKPK